MIARAGKEGLKQREKQRHFQRHDELAADTVLSKLPGQVPFCPVLRHHFEGNDACQGKHHGELPAHADQQNESCRFIAD